jgi:hypothetical protein
MPSPFRHSGLGSLRPFREEARNIEEKVTPNVTITPLPPFLAKSKVMNDLARGYTITPCGAQGIVVGGGGWQEQ